MLFTDGPGLEGVGLDKDREPIASTSGTQNMGFTPMEVDTPDSFRGNLDQNIICKYIYQLFKTFHI